jgi:glycosyltransferase involved in cell wall biosynthesis
MSPVRILFVGEVSSSHVQSWLRLLEGEEFEARGFQITGLQLPYGGELGCLTYLPLGWGRNDRPELLRRPHPVMRSALRAIGRFRPSLRAHHQYHWLAQIIRQWRPDIIQTLGLIPGGEFFYAARERYGLSSVACWVAQLRGGSDLTLTRADPIQGPRLAAVARSADALISDNMVNFDYLEALGARIAENRRLIVPGTGGIDVDALAAASTSRPSQRRLLLWPKAYTTPWAKALPVLEALRLAWSRIRPCRVVALAADQEIGDWVRLCPPSMREAIELHPRVEHGRVLDLMRQARVMLAPSLIDGTPNVMWEAMACGAVPVVSPLPTITQIVKEDENVLFARNLYPDELAHQLVRAMTDERLADSFAEANLRIVRERADRRWIKGSVTNFYRLVVSAGGRPPTVEGTPADRITQHPAP